MIGTQFVLAVEQARQCYQPGFYWRSSQFQRQDRRCLRSEMPNSDHDCANRPCASVLTLLCWCAVCVQIVDEEATKKRQEEADKAVKEGEEKPKVSNTLPSLLAAQFTCFIVASGRVLFYLGLCLWAG